jgi:hypothetical protein
MRHRWLAAVLLVVLALSLSPASAEVVDIDPEKDPVLTLDQAESQRLATLQHTVFSALVSEISPDDTTVVHIVIRPGGEDFELGFLNINDGSITPATRQVSALPPFSELRWRDGRTLVYVSFDFEVGPVLVAVDRISGQIEAQPITVRAAPVSLSPDGSRLLVARTKNAEPVEDLRAAMVSPFKLKVNRTFGSPVGLARFDAERQALQVSEDEVEFSAIDLATGESTLLLSLPDGSGLISPPAWMPNGSKLALVHMSIPKISRSGTELAEKTTQDTLGNLAPADNPFLQNNAVSVFDFPNGDLRPLALQAKDGNGDIFSRASWSTDGQTLLTQVWHPSTPAGRSNPTYLFPDRSYLRFYNAALQPIGTFDSPETAAPELMLPQFVSPDEVIITTPYGLSYRIFYYNRISGEFRQASIWDGTYFQVRASHLSRQLVFSFSSFDHAPDLYRLSWEGTALSRLTWYNGEAETQNHIRADQVTFTMQGGARGRAGWRYDQPVGRPGRAAAQSVAELRRRRAGAAAAGARGLWAAVLSRAGGCAQLWGDRCRRGRPGRAADDRARLDLARQGGHQRLLLWRLLHRPEHYPPPHALCGRQHAVYAARPVHRVGAGLHAAALLSPGPPADHRRRRVSARLADLQRDQGAHAAADLRRHIRLLAGDDLRQPARPGGHQPDRGEVPQVRQRGARPEHPHKPDDRRAGADQLVSGASGWGHKVDLSHFDTPAVAMLAV